jgi:hypothetical protein
MGGGLLQLAAYGAQDLKLTGNPQISFFKTVYRQYTNFSMESIKLDINGPTLSENNNCELTCPITRNGDLISDIYFCFELPNIYSGKHSQTGSAPFYNYEFQWIKNIGYNIFNSVSILIEGNIIDKHYSDWMHIWSELNMSDSEKNMLDEMIGNIPEIYDPSNSKGQNGLYPHITTSTNNTLQAEKYKDFNNNLIKISNANKDITIPSIKKRNIKVPLLFWFNRNKGLALPLVALQYNRIELKFELKNVNKLFTVLETDSTLTFHRKRIKPGAKSHTTLANFLIDSTMVNTSNNTRSLNFLDIKPYVEGNYIFLDNDERKRFSRNSHNYLIEQVKRVKVDGVKSTSKHSIEFDQCCKYLAWVGKRSDIDERNDWNNYTNWIYPDIAPYTNEYRYKTMFGSSVSSTPPFYTVGNTEQENNFKNSVVNKHILKNIDLSFNGILRLKEKNQDYFNRVQIYQHFKNNTNDNGIYVYSFSVNPKEFQPSGTCNFSKINLIEMTLDINELPVNNSGTNYYTYDFEVYAVTYNILRIMSGIGALEFSN